VAEQRQKTPKIPCEVQAIRIGPLGIATNGAEYFCEYGLRIKKCSPLKPTWVVSLANEWIGYLPTAQAFVGGGFQPTPARSQQNGARPGTTVGGNGAQSARKGRAEVVQLFFFALAAFALALSAVTNAACTGVLIPCCTTASTLARSPRSNAPGSSQSPGKTVL